MSLSASWLVLAVLAARFVLKKAPKWVNVLLWGLVAVRLLCPFSLESALSLIPSTEVVSPQIMLSPAPVIDTGIEAVNEAVNPIITDSFAPEPAASVNPLQLWLPILSLVWIVGITAMGEYTLFTWLRLRRQVRVAIRVNANVYLSDNIASPFVLGVFRPKIYIPYGMTELDMYHVIAHERTHILRRDHWWKPLGFTLLAVHWFNPLMWLAYLLLCRDIELACDEKVIRELGPEQRADYSQALLNCSVSHRSIAACPVAFGEVGVKERVKNVLTYRKPTFWIIVIAVILCIVVAVCFLTNPKKKDSLEWLQGLSADQVRYVEVYHHEAAPDKQYTRYEEAALLDQVVRTLRGFDGAVAAQEDTQGLLGGGYSMKVTLTDGASHTLVNHSNAYLQIDADYFADTYHILNSWNFGGTTYLPGNKPETDSFYGVCLTIEEVSPAGATVVFVGEGEKPEGRLMGGNDYWVQVEKDSVWEDITKVPEPSFTTEAYDIDNIRRHKIDWQWRYGTLPSGHYRIGKDVTYQEGAKPLETATVWAEFLLSDPAYDAHAILSGLIPEGARAEATFAAGGGYNCFHQEAQELADILRNLDESELMVSPAMNPSVSVNVYAKESLTLHYNGMYVQFTFNDSDITTPWAVDNKKLNEFMEMLLSYSPENSTYEIYNVAPLEELSEHYSVEEAMIDKVVIVMDGDARYNEAVWWEFLEKVRAGKEATVRVMHYYSPGESQMGYKVIMDLSFDGTAYQLESYEHGVYNCLPYSYLLYYAGNATDNAPYDTYEGYLLTNDPEGSAYVIDHLANGYALHGKSLIFANLIYTPKQPEIPYAVSAELRLNGKPLIVLGDETQVHELWHMMRQSVYLGYEPKTYNLGPELVFTGEDGSVTKLELDLDSDLIRYDGKFYDYGPGTNSNGNVNALPQLLSLLGLDGWPEEVKKAYPNFFAAVGDQTIPPANDLFSISRPMIIDVWYPDWAYLEIAPDQADLILEALKQEAPNPTKDLIPDVPDTVFTVHIGFDSGKEFDLAYMGQTEFCLRDFQTNQVYTFSSESLRVTVDRAISETKAAIYG